MKRKAFKKALAESIQSPGDPNLCGKVMSCIPVEEQPRFLLGVARLACEDILPEICSELEVCFSSTESMSKAKDFFHRLREVRLKTLHERERRIVGIIEKSAKLAYNLTRPPDSFDKNAGNGFMQDLCQVVNAGRAEFVVEQAYLNTAERLH